MNVQNVKIGKLKPYEKNNKKHDQRQIDNVAESIKQYGFVQPIVVDKDNVVVIGHCRLLAAKQLKMREVPCVCVDDLTDEQVRKLRIVDNKTNESEWDFENLALELDELDFSEFDMDFYDENDEFSESDFITGMLSESPHFLENKSIKDMIFKISFAFPREKHDLITSYVSKNKEKIIEKIIREAEQNA